MASFRSKSVSRKWEAEYEAVLRSYATEVGQVTVAWSHLHHVLRAIFAMLIDPGNFAPGYSAWNVLKADSAQREMLMAVARARLARDRRLLTKVLWLCKGTAELSKFRNDAAHAVPLFYSAEDGKLKIRHFEHEREATLKRLQAIGYKRLFRLVTGDLNALRVYAVWVFGELSQENKEPLPRRPILRSLQGARAPSRKKHLRRLRPEPRT